MAKKRGSTARRSKDVAARIKAQPRPGSAGLRTALSNLRTLFKSRQHDSLLWWHRVGTVLCPRITRFLFSFFRKPRSMQESES